MWQGQGHKFSFGYPNTGGLEQGGNASLSGAIEVLAAARDTEVLADRNFARSIMYKLMFWQLKVHVDNIHRVTVTEHDESYTAQYVDEVVDDTLTTVRNVNAFS